MHPRSQWQLFMIPEPILFPRVTERPPQVNRSDYRQPPTSSAADIDRRQQKTCYPLCACLYCLPPPGSLQQYPLRRFHMVPKCFSNRQNRSLSEIAKHIPSLRLWPGGEILESPLWSQPFRQYRCTPKNSKTWTAGD